MIVTTQAEWLCNYLVTLRSNEVAYVKRSISCRFQATWRTFKISCLIKVKVKRVDVADVCLAGGSFASPLCAWNYLGFCCMVFVENNRSLWIRNLCKCLFELSAKKHLPKLSFFILLITNMNYQNRIIARLNVIFQESIRKSDIPYSLKGVHSMPLWAEKNPL